MSDAEAPNTKTEGIDRSHGGRLRTGAFLGLVVVALLGVIAAFSISGDDEPDDAVIRQEHTFDDGTHVVVELGSACVPAGGEQTLRVEGPVGQSVLYQAIYADGKHGGSEGYYGGNDRGQLGDQGDWEGSWTVGSEAPPGAVAMQVVLPGYDEVFSPEFAVANADGRCTV